MVKARIYMVSLIYCINFYLQETDDIQDFSAQTVGEKVTF